MEEMDALSPIPQRGPELFHRVVNLHTAAHQGWDKLSKEIPSLPRGWFELSQLKPEDRIEFTHLFWASKLPLKTEQHIQSLDSFFEELETIEIYATQLDPGYPFEVHMIYVLQNDAGYFQGSPPASEGDVERMRQLFSPVSFPSDYLAFFHLHNGFSKYMDTGLIRLEELPRVHRYLQDLLSKEELIRPDGEVISPQQLIPFYESFGLHCYQCFYQDWYVGQEMGNIYFSEHDRMISNILDLESNAEKMAFASFLDWLFFYLEDIWHV